METLRLPSQATALSLEVSGLKVPRCSSGSGRSSACKRNLSLPEGQARPCARCLYPRLQQFQIAHALGPEVCSDSPPGLSESLGVLLRRKAPKGQTAPAGQSPLPFLHIWFSLQPCEMGATSLMLESGASEGPSSFFQSLTFVSEDASGSDS